MLNIYRRFINHHNLKSVACLQRAISSGRFPQLTSQDPLQNTSKNDSTKDGYGEKEIFLLGPADVRTPLPGNTGIPPLSILCIDTISQLPKPAGEKCEVTTSHLPEERYQYLLTQAACAAVENALSSFSIECKGFDCPQLLKKDFSDLFPRRNLNSEHLTVITLSQKTKNDMSEWSENTEIERNNLESCFTMAATAICAHLHFYSYWADFIHPNSGKPNYDSLTTATLYETDVRYRHLGFKVEDLGCCRVMLHKDWGSHVFTGAIFTNAPLKSNEVQSILYQHKLTDDVKIDLI